MTPLLAGTGALACFLLALRGLVMARHPGSVGAEGGPLLADRVREQQLVGLRILKVLERTVVPLIVVRLPPHVYIRLNRLLDNTGRAKGITVELLIASQILFTILGLTLGLVVFAYTGFVFVSFFIFLILAALPAFSVFRDGRKRQGRIERELPEFMDVLAVVMRAGMSYRSGLWRVTDELQGPVSEELRRALREMELGARRRDAFRRVGERNRSRNLGRFIVAQTQAEELGVPLAEAINTLASEMRRRYDQALRRWATRRASMIDLVNTLIILFGCLIIIAVTMVFASGLLDPNGPLQTGLQGLQGVVGGG